MSRDEEIDWLLKGLVGVLQEIVVAQGLPAKPLPQCQVISPEYDRLFPDEKSSRRWA